jgi:hypothetical protein
MHLRWPVMRMLDLPQRLSLEPEAWNVSIRFEIFRWNVPKTRIFDRQGDREDAAMPGREYLGHQSITSTRVRVSDEMRELYD